VKIERAAASGKGRIFYKDILRVHPPRTGAALAAAVHDPLRRDRYLLIGNKSFSPCAASDIMRGAPAKGE